MESELPCESLNNFYEKAKSCAGIEGLRNSEIDKYLTKSNKLFSMAEKYCDQMMTAAFLLGINSTEYNKSWKKFSKRSRGLGMALERLNEKCQDSLNIKTLKYELDMSKLYDDFYGVMASNILEEFPLVREGEKVGGIEMLKRFMKPTGSPKSLDGQDAVLKKYDAVLDEISSLYDQVKGTMLNPEGLFLVLERHRFGGNGYGLGGLRGKLNVDRMLAGCLDSKL
ncbi:hypothetical protein J4226_01570 [Candidatus Pacearchaeota archaeon]|nr:hypothetical protein [Candidatus Pacearchaeota archaeon]